MLDKEVKTALEKLLQDYDIQPLLKKVYQDFEKYQGHFQEIQGDEMDNVKKLLVGKTIASVEFINYKATSDTIVLKFTDGTNIKVVSDPNCTFDGLSFFIQKKRTVEEAYDEEVK